MRLLVVAHSYMEPLPRQKWLALQEVDPTIEIMVITPRYWPEVNLWRTRTASSREGRVTFLALPIVGAGYVSRYLIRSPRLVQALRDFRPDVIQVEAEPWSLIYLQVALLRRLIAPRSSLVFFTWWNTPRAIPFPISLTHRWCLDQTNLVIAGNHGALDVLAAHGYGGPVEVVPQVGVDLGLYHPDRKEPALAAGVSAPAAFVVGYVGQLTKRKGVDTLLDALARCPDVQWRALLVGGGPESGVLQHRAAALGIADRVTFAGIVPRKDVHAFINCMGVLVLPSTREQWEQFGHVLVEAMACGVPVIGSTSGEIPHVIADAGLVFPIGDAAALADHIRLLAQDQAAAAGFRERGLERVRRLYSHQAIARQLWQVYHGVRSAACS